MNLVKWLLHPWGTSDPDPKHLQKELEVLRDRYRDAVMEASRLTVKFDTAIESIRSLNGQIESLRDQMARVQDQNISITDKMQHISQVLELCHSREDGACTQECLACRFKETEKSLRAACTLMGEDNG